MEQTKDIVVAAISGVVSRCFGIDPASVTLETSAESLEGWDSLTHLILLTSIERRLDIQLPKQEAYQAQDVGSLVRLARDAVAARQAAA